MQVNCAARGPYLPLERTDIADTLVDAGLLDVAIIDARLQEQDNDWLVLATGHSAQHARAGMLRTVALEVRSAMLLE